MKVKYYIGNLNQNNDTTYTLDTEDPQSVFNMLEKLQDALNKEDNKKIILLEKTGEDFKLHLLYENLYDAIMTNHYLYEKYFDYIVNTSRYYIVKKDLTNIPKLEEFQKKLQSLILTY